METFMLFTDGGAFLKGEKMFDAASAFRILKKADSLEESKLYEQFVDFTPDRTIGFAEMHPIYKGLERLHSHISSLPEKEWKNHVINIYTDSNNCFRTLTAWIYGWLNYAKKHGLTIWKKAADGSVVANQDVIKLAFMYKIKLEKMGVVVRIFHINSHVTKPKLNKAIESFQKVNNYKISKKEFLYYALQNNLCDKALNDKVRELKASGLTIDELTK